MSKLYVGNVPEGAKDKELQELFEAFGEVEEVAMLRGYGFVHFVKAEDASAALNALDDSEFLGSHIQVQFARTKGHGYGRGSGPPRPRFGGGRGLVTPTHSISHLSHLHSFHSYSALLRHSTDQCRRHL
jgi:RNA recognition motif-containing protein